MRKWAIGLLVALCIAAAPSWTANAAGLPGSAGQPAPAPERPGGLIALSARIGNNWDIYAVRPADGQRIRLTSHPAEDRDPAFSPDGQTLAFSSRRDGAWNLYLLTPDGALTQVTDDLAYDGAPAWSPDGRRLAFESMRSGNLDIWVLDLAGKGAPVQMTESPHGDCGPVWSPDGTEIAFTSWRYEDQDLFAVNVETQEVRQLTSTPVEEQVSGWDAARGLLYLVTEGEQQEVYTRPADLDPALPGQRLTHWLYVGAAAQAAAEGTAGAWTGDLAFLLRHTQGARLYVQHLQVDPAPLPDANRGVRAELAQLLLDELPAAGPLSWTPIVAPWREAQGQAPALYRERTSPGEDAPYDLKPLAGVEVGNPWLSDAVDDSFAAMRQRIVAETGHDFLAQLSDAWRGVSYDSGWSAYMSWHKAGRAIDTLMDYLSPDHRERWLEVALEPGGGEVYWRLYLRCTEQDGSQGRPLTIRPWDLTADARQNLRGGRRKPVPNGYYVDLTDLMAQYGWLRIASHDHPDFHWHSNFIALEYWHFQKTEGLLR
jgi:TolB protein